MLRFIMAWLLLQSSAVYALTFEHQDWEMACDNTHTCRMAGYQVHDDAPASILITYSAGKDAKASAKVKILDAPPQASLWISGQPQGLLEFKHDQAVLSKAQLDKILTQARRLEPIEVRQGQQRWRISTQGLTAVLLKNDEYQQRVGTASALLAKGKQTLRQVRAAQAMPHYRITDYVRGKAQHYALNTAHAKRIVSGLKKSTSEDDCPLLWQHSDQETQKLTIYPINAQQVLVQVPCWQAAYNAGLGMWLMRHDLKQLQQVVTYSASSFSEGQIFARHKGRGLGDCERVEEWAFTGQRFTQTYQAADLQCKGFIGGAWSLPTWVSRVSH